MNFTGVLELLADIIQANGWFAPFIALLSGLLTSFTPCSLSAVPLIIGYVSGTAGRDTKRAFLMSVVFALGTALTYTALGIAASYTGRLLGTASPIWYLILGILMLAMVFQILGIFTFIPSHSFLAGNIRKGYIGAFTAGILAGLFSSPCSTPVLIVLLSLAVKQGNTAWGALLLFLYALGHSVLIVIAGTYTGVVSRMLNDCRYNRFSGFVKYLTALLLLILAFYMFYLWM